MAKVNKQQQTNFLENPDHVAIGDWVKHKERIGKIEGQVETGPRMLKFWVQFIDGGIEGILAYSLKKVNQPTNLYKSINLIHITIDSNLQQRVKLDNSVIDDYAIAYSEGTELPPITVWKCTDEEGNREQGIGNSENSAVARSPLPVPRYYLVDGFHRVAAAKQVGIEELPFTEKSGTYREALLFSLSVNATHGLRRSNSDKRKAVMTLLNDTEWCQWSDRHIAKITSTSHPFVAKIRSQLTGNFSSDSFCGNSFNLTGNFSSEKNNGNLDNLTGNVSSDNLHERIYITKHGTEARMNIANIGKAKSLELLPPDDDEIFSESFEDIEITDFEDNNYLDDAPVEIDNINADAELTDSTNSKTSKGKEKISNPLSVGDRVRVKDGHYFGGKEGVVTQITSPTSVMLTFDDDQRELIRLKDLDLPETLSKPQKPQKKEILIKEGLNYKAGEGCKWYVEVEEEIYKGLQVYQNRVSTPTMNGIFSGFLVEKGILKYHPDNPTKLLDLEDTKPTLKSLNISVTTLNLLQQYVNKHGEEAIVRLLAE